MELINKLKNFDYTYKQKDSGMIDYVKTAITEGHLVAELAALVPRNALMLIEQKVPKQFQEDWAYKVTTFRKRGL
jgi:hypothetical protein